MKKITLITIISIAALGAFSQGTVNFLNDTVTLPGNHLIRFQYGNVLYNVYGTNNAPAVGANFLVQLYLGASTAPEGQLIAVTSAAARLRASTTSAPGTWSSGGFRTLGGFAFGSGQVKLEVKVWDINAGATYEAAAVNGGLIGISGIFLYTLPQTAADPPVNFSMVNFPGIVFGIPEPATVPLGGLGAAALLIFRRRK